MVATLRTSVQLTDHITDDLLENDYGVVVDPGVPKSSFVAIDVDDYYHHQALQYTPEVADILLVAERQSQKQTIEIYVVEMKNIGRPGRFTVANIHGKFHTVIEDFMKVRFQNPFLDPSYSVAKMRLLFISDAYRLKKRGWSEAKIRSFLLETKIEAFQRLAPFQFRGISARIEFELPNPTISWV